MRAMLGIPRYRVKRGTIKVGVALTQAQG